jgi:hypothetical protein
VRTNCLCPNYIFSHYYISFSNWIFFVSRALISQWYIVKFQSLYF